VGDFAGGDVHKFGDRAGGMVVRVGKFVNGGS
jgi:hypothetical protein